MTGKIKREMQRQRAFKHDKEWIMKYRVFRYF